MRDSQLIAQLARAGVILPPSVTNVSTPLLQYAMDYAMDAVSLTPTLVGSANAGVPTYLTTYVDPKVIEVLVAPMKAADLVGETKKGDWTTLTAAFVQAEPTTEVATYGDYSSDGSSGANINYPQRQSYFFQTWTRWGERELEMAGAGRVDLAAQLNYASALGLAKFLNSSFLFGVANLQNYGLTNDPRLPAPVASTVNWATALPEAITNSIIAMYKAVQTQLQGLVSQEDEIKLGMPPTAAADVNNVNSYGLSAAKLLKDAFPKLEIVTVPEFDTAGGRLVQMWFPKIEGQESATCGFTEKMRAHSIERYSSYFRQKKSAGTWGAVIFRPAACSQLLGV
ncbi:major head protein [Ralstonia phage PQ43W]